MITYTNRHAHQFIEDLNEDSWYANRWKDLDIVEFKAFIGCLIYIGLHKSESESYEELWSDDDGRAKLRATISLNRFNRTTGQTIRISSSLGDIPQQMQSALFPWTEWDH